MKIMVRFRSDFASNGPNSYVVTLVIVVLVVGVLGVLVLVDDVVIVVLNVDVVI